MNKNINTNTDINTEILTPPLNTLSLRDRHILLFEDGDINRIILEDILSSFGCTVSSASDGPSGLAVFKNSPVGHFDAILMDIEMPGMNGLETTTQLRQLSRHDASGIPIIAMSAHTGDDAHQQSLDAGMNEHLSKPIDVHSLCETLIKYLNNPQH